MEYDYFELFWKNMISPKKKFWSLAYMRPEELKNAKPSQYLDLQGGTWNYHEWSENFSRPVNLDEKL